MRISGTRAGLPGVVVAVVTVVVTALAVAAGVAVRGPDGQDGPDGPVAARGGSGSPAAVAAAAAAGASAEVRALAVLHRWDRARARAWARGDPAALARLYVPGSQAGWRDVAMLRTWSRRGLRVAGLRMQVLAAALVARDRGRLVLVVTDRLAGGAARAGPVRRVLPRDRPSTRRLVFRRVAGRWLLSSVQPRASPVASTASTSGSANS